MATLDPKQSSIVFKKLRLHNDNKRCFDCPAKNPTWASVPFVLDRWTVDQLLSMVVGGNEACHAWFKSKGWADEGNTNHEAKYTSKAAVSYKQHLEKEIQRQRETIVATMFQTNDSESLAPGSGLTGLDALEHEFRSKSPSASPNNYQSSPTKSNLTQSNSSSQLSVTKAMNALNVADEQSSTSAEKDTPKGRKVIRKEHSVHSHLPMSTSSVAIPSDVTAEELQEGAATHTATLLTTNRKVASSPSNSTSSTSSLSLNKPTNSSIRSALSSKKKSSVFSVSSSINDDEDPFEAAIRDEQRRKDALSNPTPVPRAEEKIKSVISSSNNNNNQTPAIDPIKMKKFANATSISSSQMFSDETDEDREADRARFQQFGSANAIGSDAFFGRQREDDEAHDSVDLNALKDSAAQKARQLASMAGALFNSVRRY